MDSAFLSVPSSWGVLLQHLLGYGAMVR